MPCIQGRYVYKTHDGGIKDMKFDRKEVWVYPRNNLNRCPVRLAQKYLSLCPKYDRKHNFYLKSLTKPTPTQWYAEQVVGQNTLGKVIKGIMQNAGVEGFYTNHSARRTGGTRLFRAGVQRKLVKETTGHRSDAIDKYQITSDDQREQMSAIMANEGVSNVREISQVPIEENSKREEVTISENVDKTEGKVSVQPNMQNLNVGEFVTQLLQGARQGGKNTIEITIKIHNE